MMKKEMLDSYVNIVTWLGFKAITGIAEKNEQKKYTETKQLLNQKRKLELMFRKSVNNKASLLLFITSLR